MMGWNLFKRLVNKGLNKKDTQSDTNGELLSTINSTKSEVYR